VSDHAPETVKGLPHNWFTEAALLGALLLNPEPIADVRVQCPPSSFHRPAHQTLFRLMCQMADAGTPPDMITVLDQVEARDMASSVGGLAYLTGLVQTAAISENVTVYARRIRLHSERAAAIERIRRMEERLLEDPDADPAALLSAALDATESSRPDRGTWHSYGDLIPARLQEIAERLNRPSTLPGISTGMPDLDALLGGLEPGCLYLFAGRPAMGKSLVEDQIAAHVARTVGPVGKFQLEMAKEKVAERVIVRESRFDNGKLRRGEVSQDDWRLLCDGGERGAALPIYIDDTPGLTVEELRSRARALKRQFPGLALLTIDYIQLLQSAAAGRGASREERMANVSKAAKVMAKELGVPVIALGQLSRACEQREDKRPMMSDLRESGQLEQDADGIVFVYRDEVYTKDACPKPGIVELIVAKARDGRLGTVERAFRGEFYAVDELDRYHEAPPRQERSTRTYARGRHHTEEA
jgi:replicative DNA helicase